MIERPLEERENEQKSILSPPYELVALWHHIIQLQV
jgi:hypothetical protein